MSKLIYFQDGHYKRINSANRIGDYSRDWLLKFDEILQIAKKYKAEAILDGGDLLDSPEPAYRVLDDIADRVEAVKIPIYSLFGNHAERYHSMDHSKYTGMAHLQKRSAYFKYFNKMTGEDFHVECVEYSHDVEEKLKEDGIQILGVDDKWKIAIVHAFVCPKPFPYACHVVCDDIKTNADLVLVAHYHSVWGKQVGGTQYLDIGCLGRNSITEANIEPSCVLLDTENRSYEIIKLKSAKKASEIFDLTKIEEFKELDTNMQHFIQSLESVNFQGQSIEAIIKSVAEQEKVDSSIVSLIMDKIERLK